VSIRVSDALSHGSEALKYAGIEAPNLESRVLLQHTGVDVWRTDAIASDNAFSKFCDLIRQRTSRVPIAYLVGKREFYSLEFKVNKHVLIPRPDSEVLIDEALARFDHASKIKILDLGVGSGCLLLTLLKNFPQSTGTGVDISMDAIEVARQNYCELGLTNDIQFINTDWASLTLTSKFDLIVCNPPYIESSEIPKLDEDVNLYEPHTALDGGVDGLDCYKSAFPMIRSLLSNQGVAIVEYGFAQARKVSDLSEQYGLQVVKIARDLNGIERCAVLILS
jgi:release factor glutamine methyltransferase